MTIPFNKPHMTGRELSYISQAHHFGHLSGDGPFSKKCHAWLEATLGCKRALLTHSCTAALEMAAILFDIKAGDEVIMPSFTFVSTANAFVLRGAVPVFIDIRPDTLNMDERLIEQAITPKTRVIVPVHYAGVACEMDTIMEIAGRHKLLVAEDAAQALLSKYKGEYLGTIGHLGCLSFHETKNIISGEGGAILINKKSYIERAEIIREKGTDKSKFLRGLASKYTWVDTGSSFLPNELVGSFLYAQLEESETIIKGRYKIFKRYYDNLRPLAEQGYFPLPLTPDECTNNGHIFYIITRTRKERTALINYLNNIGISALFHYVPLHSSPAGLKYGRTVGAMTVTDRASDCVVRLPLYNDLTKDEVDKVSESVMAFYKTRQRRTTT